MNTTNMELLIIIKQENTTEMEESPLSSDYEEYIADNGH